MKFKVKATKAYLEDGSIVREGIINATGKKAEMLSKLSSRTVEILEGNDEVKKEEVKKETVREESEEGFESKSQFKKKIRN